jgi:hypothetical protein
MAIPVYDEFTDTNGVQIEDHGTEWALNTGGGLNGNVDIQSNATAPDSTGINGVGYRTDETFANNQYAEGYVREVAAGLFLGLSVRNQAGGTLYGWNVDAADQGYLELWDAGSWSLIQNSGGLISKGDVMRLECEGTALRTYINGVLDFSETDPDVGSGAPGLYHFGDGATSLLDAFSAGDLGHFGDIVQWRKAGKPYSTGDDFVSVTLPNAITEGNLLVALHFTGDANSIAPSGFSEAVALTDGTNADQGAIYYKVAGSSESTTITASSGSADEQMLVVYEVVGPFAASPLDQTDSDGPSVTTNLSLATSALAQADEFVVVLATQRAVGAYCTEMTGGIANRGRQSSADAKMIVTGYAVPNSTDAISTTITLDNSQYMMAGIATFKKASAVVEPSPKVLSPSVQQVPLELLNI